MGALKFTALSYHSCQQDISINLKSLANIESAFNINNIRIKVS